MTALTRALETVKSMLQSTGKRWVGAPKVKVNKEVDGALRV